MTQTQSVPSSQTDAPPAYQGPAESASLAGPAAGWAAEAAGPPPAGVAWMLGLPMEINSRLIGRYRSWMILRGMAGLILGGMILFQPGLSVAAFALVIGIFLCVIGVARIVIGAADTGFSTGVRVLNVILGVMLAVIGAIAIRFPGFGLLTTVLLIGFAWMMEAGATLALLPPRHQGRGWAIAFAVVSLIAGAALIAWPVESLLPLAIVAGAALLVGGVFDLINAFTLKASDRS
ncbi:MAG: DUF308 domain-containing protein [Bifidobacteriaceae bacterium]|jgi:uncharacterized membrane protein HdeD (DUF308 family)|nr:DUF308 domain-containing protein [Bifidobacteriaceae bacterium]